jgi:hypothetical protein
MGSSAYGVFQRDAFSNVLNCMAECRDACIGSAAEAKAAPGRRGKRTRACSEDDDDEDDYEDICDISKPSFGRGNPTEVLVALLADTSALLSSKPVMLNHDDLCQVEMPPSWLETLFFYRCESAQSLP